MPRPLVYRVAGQGQNRRMQPDLPSLVERWQGAGIITNKNTIPYDTRSPFVGSGLRLGTPALTSRGMGPDEMRRVAAWMLRVLKDPDGEGVRETVRQEVAAFAAAFPVPGITDATVAVG